MVRHTHGPPDAAGSPAYGHLQDAGGASSDHVHEAGRAAGHPRTRRAVSERRLLLSMIVTGSVMAIEFVGGYLTHSLALVSDAGHMLTHFFALALSWSAIRIATRPFRPRQSYGLYRAEILAAYTNGVFLAVVTAYIAYKAIERLFSPVEVAGLEMLAVAALGLVANLASVGLLWGAGREDLNVRSAMLHMFSDTFSSVAVVVAAVVIMTVGWVQVDPLLGLVICALIGVWSWRLLERVANRLSYRSGVSR